MVLAGNKEGEGATVAVTVKLGNDGTPEDKTAQLIAVPDGKEGYTYAFELNLSDIAAERTNANELLEITYKAYVTSTVIDNHAQTKVKTEAELEDGPGADDKIYTGSLKLTKTNADAAGETLANAKFVLYYEKDNKTYYAVTKASGDAYEVTGWSETKPDETNDEVLLITKDDGTFTVKGLEDDDDRAYKFEEVVAPEGYSLNAEPVGITSWKDGKRNDAATAQDRLGEAQISDTKLSALPSTGGIGTTIFTIAGCLIMIAAAGLFFVSRRKTEK